MCPSPLGGKFAIVCLLIKDYKIVVQNNFSYSTASSITFKAFKCEREGSPSVNKKGEQALASLNRRKINGFANHASTIT